MLKINNLHTIPFANMRKDIVFNEWGCEHYGRVNWMKGAINYADKVVAVSPNYTDTLWSSPYGYILSKVRLSFS